jgi:hypothetical protein
MLEPLNNGRRVPMFQLFIMACTAAIIAASAAAQTAEPRFFIERIEVRNAQRVSPAIVISETLLRDGTEYSEDDLRAASSRLARLPFLLSAAFALEKGSDRGRYKLIINVTETRPFFFFIDARPTLLDDSRHTVDYDVDPSSESKDAALGTRWFVGGRGIVHAGVIARRDQKEFTPSYSAWVVGYTQYDLFGTRAFATFNVRLPFGAPAQSLSPQLVIGLPLTANQTLTADLEDTHFRRDKKTVLGITFDRTDSERLLSLTWTYNTTNDPFVPTRGTVIRIAPQRMMNDRASVQFTRPAPDVSPQAYAQHVSGYGADLGASHYWELSERDSISAGVLAGWLDLDDRIHPPLRSDILWRPAYEVFRGGYSRLLRRDEGGSGESRIELGARFVAHQRNVRQGEEVFGVSPPNDSSFQTSVNWVRRSSWGMLRIGVGYAWGH